MVVRHLIVRSTFEEYVEFTFDAYSVELILKLQIKWPAGIGRTYSYLRVGLWLLTC